ncbi:hypothetical protein C8J57DRAFT_1704863 [Mycena rebaudengoi]|nr:hypothetical protein C8J57DRAFT_1704863 [Mycena rebaudengoi]
MNVLVCAALLRILNKLRRCRPAALLRPRRSLAEQQKDGTTHGADWCLVVGRWALGAVAPSTEEDIVCNVAQGKVFLSESLERSASHTAAMEDPPAQISRGSAQGLLSPRCSAARTRQSSAIGAGISGKNAGPGNATHEYWRFAPAALAKDALREFGHAVRKVVPSFPAKLSTDARVAIYLSKAMDGASVGLYAPYVHAEPTAQRASRYALSVPELEVHVHGGRNALHESPMADAAEKVNALRTARTSLPPRAHRALHRCAERPPFVDWYMRENLWDEFADTARAWRAAARGAVETEAWGR